MERVGEGKGVRKGMDEVVRAGSLQVVPRGLVVPPAATLITLLITSAVRAAVLLSTSR